MPDAIDLRSDTVTRPTAAMKQAMLEAELGDDVFGDDPTVNALEAKAAALAGKAAGLFLPTGTQSNLVGLLAHCQRGDEYIVGQQAHAYCWEGGGAAVLGGIQPQPLEQDARGCMSLAAIAAAVKPDDSHFARTRLLALENTWGGRALDARYLDDATSVARQHGLATHLDGARVFNAVIATGQSLADMARDFDTVSICLSKGLGAPAGSVLVGSQDLVDSARRWRKVTGGGMRQSGMLAAAGIHALDNHVDRLAEDHARAEKLATGLRGLGYDVDGPETNMVFVTPGAAGDRLKTLAEERGIRLPAGEHIRLVLHLDIDDAALEQVLDLFAAARA
ncbi:MAG: low-specificity L-threonine aldolase [Gammaproteobacteria bacterium]|nr:low-specificity L-threonine aldolase [Gammaproteobacteria bacterium]